MTDWWRSWHGAPTDAKWLVIGRKASVPPGIASAVGWALMDFASQREDRGSIEGFDVETYAVFSGWEESQVYAVISAMVDKRMIVDGRFASWEKRQPAREDEGAAERKRLQREREKLAKEAEKTCVTGVDVTSCHDDVTQCHAPEQSRAEQIQSREESKQQREDAARDPAAAAALLEIFEKVRKFHTGNPPAKRRRAVDQTAAITLAAAGVTPERFEKLCRERFAERADANQSLPGGVAYFLPAVDELLATGGNIAAPTKGKPMSEPDRMKALAWKRDKGMLTSPQEIDQLSAFEAQHGAVHA